MNGYELCEKLKRDSKHKEIPIIFISTLSGFEDKIKAFSLGGDDYISKPLLQSELLARVKLHLQKRILYKSIKQLLRKSYHELYNPLSIINTSLEMQNIIYGDSKYIDAITVASRSLQVVYDDLYYSLSPDDNSKNIVKIELIEFVKKRIKYFYYLQKSKNIEIDLISNDRCIIDMEETDLQRVIDNTLSNAIKYANPDTIVYISVLNEENCVVFETKNRGITIENPQKIFNNGYREDYEKIGMGIGLEIVASICSRYKIKTEVISADGETSFKYSILKG